MKKKKIPEKELSSFRDPSGFVYYADDKIYRQVNSSYKQEYLLFTESGLSQRLIKDQLLTPFSEVKTSQKVSDNVFTQLVVDKIPFVSYPYEWSFSQLKDAALLTLKIQKIALEYGMSLKDASAYNVQFLKGKPIFIDLLSFEQYQEGHPWVAYQQFCEYFLGPLALMAKVDLRFNLLFKTHLNGIPLDLVSKLLPKASFFNFSLLSHLHLHARNQKKYASFTEEKKVEIQQKLSKTMLLGIIESLESTVKSLKLNKYDTEWGEYYTFTNYSDKAFEAKKTVVKNLISEVKPKSVWDLGGNTGEFSRLASQQKIQTLSFDIDPLAVEKNYLQVKQQKETQILPLLMDLMNPSPDLGWHLAERKSLLARGPADLVMALALIHHLCISNNLPFEFLARFCHQLGKHLIIEFVPKEDSKVQILLATRKDIFPDYNQEAFEKVFSQFYQIKKKIPLKLGSKRTIYLMTTKL